MSELIAIFLGCAAGELAFRAARCLWLVCWPKRRVIAMHTDKPICVASKHIPKDVIM
jgi:hypothetical protein